MTRSLFKHLSGQYRKAFKQALNGNDNALKCYFNSLGNTRKAYEVLCLVQNCCVNSKTEDVYYAVSGEYIWFKFITSK